jgi:GR25 family glycosyltransferase involved in LPS biosynthesis
MILKEVVPYMVCVNLAHRDDRRRKAWKTFADAGLDVDRQPGVPKGRVRDPRGYYQPQRYACSLAKRLAIRRAKLAGAPAVLLFEDDIVLAPDLHERLAEIDLPADWGIFFLGCRHIQRPVPVHQGLVRVTSAVDHHAMVIRADHYHRVMAALAGHGKGAPKTLRFSDLKMSKVIQEMSAYGAYPNLAWQALSFSSNDNRLMSNYGPDGGQRTDLFAVDGLEEEMEELRIPHTQPPHEASGPALRFETRPRTYRESPAPLDPQAEDQPDYGFLVGAPQVLLERKFPLRLYVNLGRHDARRHEAEYQFAMQGLEVERLAAADGRGVRNTRGHSGEDRYGRDLSHRMAIRQAKLRKAPSVLIFEDDVVLHPDFRRLVEAHEPPEDWGVLCYGCTHVEAPEVVAPGWVRITKAWCLQAYAVRAQWYDLILRSLRAPSGSDDPFGADEKLATLSDRIPMYAAYPNLAWQGSGFSNLRNTERKEFDANGRQLRFCDVIRETDREMRRILKEAVPHVEVAADRPHLMARVL